MQPSQKPPHLKTLLVVRHAKSSWKDETLADRDRPLNKRGVRNAPEMGQRLLRRRLTPDTIISSPAVRALSTAKAIAKALAFPVSEIIVEEDLYGCEPQDLIDVAALISTDFKIATLVSHNPAVTELANALSVEPIDDVPTCGILTLQAKSWNTMATAELTDFDYPKKSQSDEVSQRRSENDIEPIV